MARAIYPRAADHGGPFKGKRQSVRPLGVPGRAQLWRQRATCRTGLKRFVEPVPSVSS
jgi:hypothetical protein